MTQFELPFIISDHPWYGYYWKGMEIGAERVSTNTHDLEDAIETVYEYLYRSDWCLLTALHVGIVHGIENTLRKKE